MHSLVSSIVVITHALLLVSPFTSFILLLFTHSSFVIPRKSVISSSLYFASSIPSILFSIPNSSPASEVILDTTFTDDLGGTSFTSCIVIL